MGTKILLFGEISSGLLKLKLNCLAIMIIVMFGGKRGGLQANEHHPNAGGTGALHKIDGIMRRSNYVDILKQQSMVANGSSKWTMAPSKLPKLWQNG